MTSPAEPKPANDAARANALATTIAGVTKSELAADFTKLTEYVLKVLVNTNAILTRLETMDVATGSGTAPKRAVRAAGAKAAGGKKTAATAKKGGDKSKITNTLLYFRHMMADNLDEVRETYGTPENLEEAEKDATVGKQDKEKDAPAYWSAVGAALWKRVLTNEEKDTIRALFNSWKEQSVRDDAEEPLEEEGV